MNMNETCPDFRDLYLADNFKRQGYQIIDMLAEHLKQTKQRDNNTVLPAMLPEEMLENWSNNFFEGPEITLQEIISKVISMSNNLHHPRFIGHQAAGPLPTAILCDLVSSFMNNTSAAFEMGPVSTIMETRVIQWMAKMIGYEKNASGIFTSGGTVGNLTALLAARQNKAGYDIWNSGVKSDPSLSVMISEQAHYSAERAVQVIGLGSEGVIKVPSDHNYCMDLEALDFQYRKALKESKKVICVVANACSTATGSYDPLEKIADFCEKHKLWMHVDGAHGASALLSDKYKPLLKGLERADSVIWDAHKMMLMPALLTAVIFKDGSTSYESFSQEASYIFEKDPQEEWYNLCHRTMECTKTMMVLKLYASLMVHGTKVFSDYLTYTYDIAKQFGDMLDESSDFSLPAFPQSNIVCYRYVGRQANDLNQLQKDIRKRILKAEGFYITQADLKGQTHMRCTIINPHTTIEDLTALMEQIRQVAATL